ncbi:DUF2809 domain-containing protein [Flavobacterium dankookense]|uniref:Uncharacterized protein DUF2809 n=1 Tax=Flavobacterium dankookense TaxID=706186 RepID=A0A4R6QG59_9FLAO|nr:DUF2809 domain-containing protein [Flavobacterium dankookense]TDP61960.1 uncharacterized protein DUF2809 [Flavobacterium dankookense]
MFKWCFNRNYFLSFLLLFVIEVLIALYVHDDFIRPYFGDFLVVLLLYCFLMGFIKSNKYIIAVIVLIFAFLIEFAQFLNVIKLFGLQNNTLARTVIGTSFSNHDLLIYFLAFIIVIGFEYVSTKKIN